MDRERYAAITDDLRRASAELTEALAAGRAELDELRRGPLVDADDRRALQEAAERGAMGREMQDFADEVRRGRADWEQMLRGQGEHGSLRDAMVQRAQDERGEELAQAFADSPAPRDVDDPRGPDRRPPRPAAGPDGS